MKICCSRWVDTVESGRIKRQLSLPSAGASAESFDAGHARGFTDVSPHGHYRIGIDCPTRTRYIRPPSQSARRITSVIPMLRSDRIPTPG